MRVSPEGRRPGTHERVRQSAVVPVGGPPVTRSRLSARLLEFEQPAPRESGVLPARIDAAATAAIALRSRVYPSERWEPRVSPPRRQERSPGRLMGGDLARGEIGPEKRPADSDVHDVR